MSPQQDSQWWGGHGRGRDRLTLLDLIRNHTLDLKLASLLWHLVEKKASIMVAAAPQFAGKTTLLTAILDFMPPWFAGVNTRGEDEDFSFLTHSEPSSTYILVPELSDHTPAYLWGEAVQTLFQAMDQGFSMATTIHADSAEEVMALLQGPPVYVPSRLLHHLHAIVTLRLTYAKREMARRVHALTILLPPEEGSQSPHPLLLVRWDQDRDTFEHDIFPLTSRMTAARLGMDGEELQADLASRCEILESWLSNGPVAASELRQVVVKHYRASSA